MTEQGWGSGMPRDLPVGAPCLRQVFCGLLASLDQLQSRLVFDWSVTSFFAKLFIYLNN